VIGPSAASAQVTTTTAGATTTTLPEQKTITGSATSQNNCTSVLNPPIQEGGNTKIGVTMSSTAFGQPHLGKEISLTNTKATISIPADLLQLGVDAGIIFDNQQIPSTVNLVIAGDGTTQKTHAFTINSTVTVHVTGGVAKPLTSTLNLPNTKWTPVSQEQDVFFHEKSMTITSTIDLSASLGITVIATFTCSGRAPDFIALGGLTAPATTTSAAPVTTVAPTTAVAPVTQAAPTEPTELPRTGSNTGLLLAMAVGLLSAGLFALKATGRRAARSRS